MKEQDTNTYQARGKLLLSSEYLVLLGGKALALPVKFGQTLRVETNNSDELHWQSFEKGKLWFEVVFDLNGLNLKTCSDDPTAKTLKQILIEAKSQNALFLSEASGYDVKTTIDFKREWGLGTSSTLIATVAQWAAVDPYQLNKKIFNGSGYDIACANTKRPIVYQKKNDKVLITGVDFHPSFSNQLYFVFLNRKQNSKDSIASLDKSKDYSLEIEQVNSLTKQMLNCRNMGQFQHLMEQHETIIAAILNQPPVKKKLFADFNGAIKSLGAWGGDFVLAASEMCEQELKAYFQAKGFHTIFKWNEMIDTPLDLSASVRPDSVSKITWRAPSNIALIKYWGKHGVQLPNNPSLSMSLKNSVTETSVSYSPKTSEGISLEYYFEGEQNSDFEIKVKKYLYRLVYEFPWLERVHLKIESSNTFPHSTGIASSASSMAALALCSLSIDESIRGEKYNQSEFFRKASGVARLGSGSASRSVFGGWASWGKMEGFDESSDEFASPLKMKIHPLFHKMGDAVLIVSSKKKSVSSTLGHSLMDKHPFAEARYQQARQHFNALMQAMASGNFNAFTEIVENEALSLHGLLMTSSADGLLLKPGSIAIIDAVRKFRNETGTKVCFTIDAGPNMHLLYPIEEKQKVLEFIKSRLLQYCENQQWLDDETGFGPENI